jgi:glutaredoxin
MNLNKFDKFNKFKSNKILQSIFIIIIIILLIIILIMLIKKFSPISKVDSEMHEYDIMTPLKGESENMLKCPKGCIRGVCNKTNNKDGCKNDIDCQYCKDDKTNMFYVNFDNEKNIIPLLEEEHQLNLTQRDLLNNSIKDNNHYIHELNEKIKKMNN